MKQTSNVYFAIIFTTFDLWWGLSSRNLRLYCLVYQLCDCESKFWRLSFEFFQKTVSLRTHMFHSVYEQFTLCKYRCRCCKRSTNSHTVNRLSPSVPLDDDQRMDPIFDAMNNTNSYRDVYPYITSTVTFTDAENAYSEVKDSLLLPKVIRKSSQNYGESDSLSSSEDHYETAVVDYESCIMAKDICNVNDYYVYTPLASSVIVKRLGAAKCIIESLRRSHSWPSVEERQPEDTETCGKRSKSFLICSDAMAWLLNVHSYNLSYYETTPTYNWETQLCL